MTAKYIWLSGKRYYLYDKYDSYNEALKNGMKFRKRMKTRTFILPIEEGMLIPEKRYALYMNKVIKIW